MRTSVAHRTNKQIAQVVAKTIKEIRKAKISQKHNADEFNELVAKTCNKYDIAEYYIRKVAIWDMDVKRDNLGMM